MIMACLSPEERVRFMIQGNISDYRYLNQSGCSTVNGRNEQEEYAAMIKAMQDLNFDNEIQALVFRVLAGILNLGNVRFVETGSADDSCRVAPGPEVQAVGDLLGVAVAPLERALCFRATVVEGKSMQIPLRVEQAAAQVRIC